MQPALLNLEKAHLFDPENEKVIQQACFHHTQGPLPMRPRGRF
jgi:hypothetical protein